MITEPNLLLLGPESSRWCWGTSNRVANDFTKRFFKLFERATLPRILGYAPSQYFHCPLALAIYALFEEGEQRVAQAVHIGSLIRNTKSLQSHF